MKPTPPSGTRTADAASDTPQRQRAAMTLIRTRRTMVLATGMADEPWAAPVYFVYSAPGFYFFSSPDARHITQALAAGTAAAAIFLDSDQWEEIQGVQMSGAIAKVDRPGEQIKAGARFIAKFPFARSFLLSGTQKAGAPPKLGDKVQFYVFTPCIVYYVNNRLGFGQRMPVDLNGQP